MTADGLTIFDHAELTADRARFWLVATSANNKPTLKPPLRTGTTGNSEGFKNEAHQGTDKPPTR